MKNLLLMAPALMLCSFADGQAPFADPASVLVIVQDNTGPEAGTGTQNASRYVADYYMQRRGIPSGNIVHIATFIDSCGGPGCPNGNIPHSDSTNISAALYQTRIAAPVLAALNANGGALRKKIRYIVPVYGVPVTIAGATSSDTISLDSALAGLLLPPQGHLAANPYYNADPASSPSHIDTSNSGVLLVSRLDGRTAALAAGLVDKAIAGEKLGVQGTGYFDWQGQGTATNRSGYPFQPDFSMLNAYTLCAALIPAQTCVLNDQRATGGMISSAPNAAWVWGWYDLGASNASAYTFVPGAVGAQLTSNTANCIRRPCTGAYVDLWLAAGITATWGAVNEPFASTYALGDNLLGHLWRGYTFGEAAYISSPTLNWMMVFVGDPLYRPSHAQSATAYYVATDGDDSNPGTQGAPFRHLSKAAQTATQPGDTVIVLDGTYDNESVVAPDSVVNLLSSGTPGSPITFRAQNRGNAVLDSMNSLATPGCDGASAYFNLKNASFIVIQGFVFQNGCDAGIQSNDAAHDIVIQWNEIRNIANNTATDPIGRNGIYLNNSQYSFIFDGNSFHDIGGTDGQTGRRFDHGIYGGAQNVTVTNNVFYNIKEGWPIQFADGAANWLISNNTFAFPNEDDRGGQIMMCDTQSNIVIRNNIFFIPAGYAIARCQSSVTSCAIDHNLVFGASAMMADSSGCTIDATNQMGADPAFVNAWTPPYDFHVQAASPAIGTGAPTPGVTVDFDGTTRASAPDIGAYAFVPAAP